MSMITMCTHNVHTTLKINGIEINEMDNFMAPSLLSTVNKYIFQYCIPPERL
jgi:hypothetical protein